jgi:hypothetical protein
MIERDRRLAILAALLVAPGYTMARTTLQRRLEAVGYYVSGDALAIDIAWLDETAGLVEPLELDAVRLTERGADVVIGRATVPGVTRPGPGEIPHGAR